jgi:hypothetical protein
MWQGEGDRGHIWSIAQHHAEDSVSLPTPSTVTEGEEGAHALKLKEHGIPLHGELMLEELLLT